MTPTSPRSLFLPTLLVCGLLLRRALAGRIPIKYQLNSKQTECIYEELVDKDVVTFSVFVVEALGNGKPKVAVSFEGPVAGNKDILPRFGDDHSDIDNNNDQDGQGEDEKIGRTIRSGLLSDWPKISDHPPNGVVRRNFQVDWTHAGESEDAAMARSALLQENHEKFRMHSMENEGKEDRERAPLPLHTLAQSFIEPFEETHEITARGWYRLCVRSDFAPLVVEMEMRTAQKLMGINPGTGHVYTYELREYHDEQRMLFGDPNEEGRQVFDTFDGQRQVRVDDMQEAKIKLRYMHELTSQIMKTQHDKMHRIRAHDADARRGAAALARSSKVETLLYVAITGLQVYTVHKWLLGNLLGK